MCAHCVCAHVCTVHMCAHVCVHVCVVCTVSAPAPQQRHQHCSSFQALPGPHYYAWGDHGGIIVAIAQGTETSELK